MKLETFSITRNMFDFIRGWTPMGGDTRWYNPVLAGMKYTPQQVTLEVISSGEVENVANLLIFVCNPEWTDVKYIIRLVLNNTEQLMRAVQDNSRNFISICYAMKINKKDKYFPLHAVPPLVEKMPFYEENYQEPMAISIRGARVYQPAIRRDTSISGELYLSSDNRLSEKLKVKQKHKGDRICLFK